MPVLREDIVTPVVHAALGQRRPVCVTPLRDSSRRTWRVVVDGPAEAYVLRAHGHGSLACAIETTLVRRLRGVVPVPELVYADPGGEVTGVPVTLTRWVHGQRLCDVLPRCDPGEVAELGYAAGTVLARIGTVTFDRGGSFGSADLTVRPTLGTPGQRLIGYAWDRLRRTVRSMSDKLRRQFVELIVREAPLLNQIDGANQLVHGSFGMNTLLVARRTGRWRVVAVVGWSRGYAGSPLADLGSVLRGRDALPAGFVDPMLTGFGEAGGELLDGWEKISRVLDAFALCDLLAADPPGPLSVKARNIAGQAVARGAL